MLTENLEIYQERWAGQPFEAGKDSSTQGLEMWTREQLCREIQSQEADKSCGADGIHIQLLKCLQDTPLIDWLLALYKIHVEPNNKHLWHRINRKSTYWQRMLTNAGDAENLRPISIICLFRKVFERLLLLDCQGQAWAKLHRGQAGFRRTYSTRSNVAVVHTLLQSKERSTAVFLDLKSAYDVVDHTRLDGKLQIRGCPEPIRWILQSLMFTRLRSRLLINEQITDWFPRTRGVLQGSPLSPW